MASTSQTFYDAAGNVAETVNPLGHAWDYVYDARNRKVQELEPSVLDAVSNTTVRPILNWHYDLAGRVTATIDARNNETDTIYDPANRVTDVYQPSVAVPGGNPARPRTHTDYDFDGNPIHVYNPNDSVAAGGTFGGNSPCITNVYDDDNRLHATTDEAGDTVTYGYDQVGNKTSVQDGDGNTTTFSYDGLNRNTQVTDAAGQSTNFQYDGLVKTQRTDAIGQVTNYAYDNRNRLQTVSYVSSVAANAQRTYAYDYVGNLLSVSEQGKTAANVGYGYDALNRVTSETSQGQTHTYGYDLAGNRTSTIYGGTGRTLTCTYDSLNRLSTLQTRPRPKSPPTAPGASPATATTSTATSSRKFCPMVTRRAHWK